MRYLIIYINIKLHFLLASYGYPCIFPKKNVPIDTVIGYLIKNFDEYLLYYIFFIIHIIKGVYPYLIQ